MKSLSVKLKEDVFREMEAIRASLGQSRERYFNDALAFYNAFQKRRQLERQLAEESELVREESMAVLREFESLEDEEL